MAKQEFTNAKKISGMAASLTVFLCSAIIFVRTKGLIDLNTLLYSLYIIIPGAVIVGWLGYNIGSIFDNTKKKKKLNKFMK